MKMFNQIIALCLLGSATAFTVNSPKVSSPVVLNALNPEDTVNLDSVNPSESFEIFPTFENLEYIEPGNTIRTYQMPSWATRVQMRFETNGRPLRGEANLWIGPIRKVHTLKFDTESGVEFPIETLLNFKKVSPVLKISTGDNQNYPMKVGVFVPPPDRALELKENTEGLFDNCPKNSKVRIQGSNTDGKYGARRNWVVPEDVESVQMLAWNRDSGKKSFKLDIELLQGPNNIKQKFFLQCGGSTQPFHAVLQTPGRGWTVRMRNKKYVEDGLIDVAVVPYKTAKVDYGAPMLSWNDTL